MHSFGTDSKYNTYSMIRVLSNIKSGLKISHINAQSLNGKIDEFRYIFENSNVDIICVSETWFRSDICDNIYNMTNYKLYRADRASHAGGVAIYVRKSIKCNVITQSGIDDKIEYLFLEISNGTEKLLLGNVYRPHRYVDFNPLITMLATISLNYNDILISGDFNSNILQEKTLLREMQTIGLNSVNNEIPTHYSSTVNTLLDLFLTNNTSKILLYDQLSVPVFSKHDLIFTTIDFKLRSDNAGDAYSFRDFKRINYDALNLQMSTILWDQIYYLPSIDEKVIFLQNNILELFEEFVPLKTRRIIIGNKPWFNDEIKKLINLRNIAFNKWKRFKIPHFFSLYHTLRNRVTYKIRDAKSKYYGSKFSSSIDSRSKWKVIRDIGIVKNKNKVECVPNVDELNEQFVNLTIPAGNSDFYLNLGRQQDQNEFQFVCFSNSDVLCALLSIKSNAVGFDGIHPAFLRIILPKILCYITHLFNAIVTTSTYPTSWKYAKVLAIPKAGNAFRPIAILPYFSKALERLLHTQINEFLRDNSLLSMVQSGFRPKLGCVSALIKVSDDIRSQQDDDYITFLLLLDHTKAFDTVDHSILLFKLDRMFNFSPTAVKLMSSYLHGRCQSVYSGDTISSILYLSRGVPQGSILGPLLYTLYANDLPDQLHFCNVHMYADDVQLYTSTRIRDVKSCMDNINSDLSSLVKWATANGLCINPSKSKYLIIHKRRQNPLVDQSLSLRLGDSTIKLVESAKNLGIVFDKFLNWTDHVNITTGRVYGMLRNLWLTQYFTPLNIRMLLAKTYLVPTLIYGCELFAFCNSDSKRKLNVTYNNIARYVFGLKRFDRVSDYSKKIFGLSFDNLLICRSLIFLHKIIYTCTPSYLYDKLSFMRSNRGKRLVQIRHNSHLSEQHFFVNTIRIWNQLPVPIQTTSNARQFKTLVFNHFENKV